MPPTKPGIEPRNADSSDAGTAMKARQERFCHRFVECANAAAAAKAAGYAPGSARNTGYRLLRNPRIVSRIAQLQAEMAQANCRELDTLLGKLETVYRRAVDGHQFSAAARAVELQAKLAGLADKPSVRALVTRAKEAGQTAADAQPEVREGGPSADRPAPVGPAGAEPDGGSG
jgi:phage terminase small subunit